MKNTYRIDGNNVYIKIIRKKYDDIECVVSLSDFQQVSAIRGSWSVHYGQGGKLYIKTRIIRTEQILLHRYLTNCSKDMDVDHIDGDTLNNARSNLRVVPHADNCQNRVRSNKNNKGTGVKGVRRMKSGKFQASIKRNYRFIHIGMFDTIKEAEKAVLEYNAS